jgi:hypothetical protein
MRLKLGFAELVNLFDEVTNVTKKYGEYQL